MQIKEAVIGEQSKEEGREQMYLVKIYFNHNMGRVITHLTKAEAEEIARRINEPDRILGIVNAMLKERKTSVYEFYQSATDIIEKLKAKIEAK